MLFGPVRVSARPRGLRLRVVAGHPTREMRRVRVAMSTARRSARSLRALPVRSLRDTTLLRLHFSALDLGAVRASPQNEGLHPATDSWAFLKLSGLRQPTPAHANVDLHGAPDRPKTLPIVADKDLGIRCQRDTKGLFIPREEFFGQIVDIEPF